MINCKNCKMTDEYCASGDCPNDTLTGQWKKGELPVGFYYIELPGGRGGNGISKYTTFISPSSKIRIKEVVAPVPSYEEWRQLKEYERIVKSYYGKPIDYDIACETVNKLLDEKNFLKEEISAYKRRVAELKELLKEVLRHELSLKEVSELTRKIGQALGAEQ